MSFDCIRPPEGAASRGLWPVSEKGRTVTRSTNTLGTRLRNEELEETPGRWSAP